MRTLKIMLFRSVNLIRRVGVKSFSSRESFIELSLDQDAIALVSLKRQPVNSFNLEFLQELSCTVDVVRENKYKGMIITSATKVFSAGIDLNEFNNPDPKRLRTMWSTIQDLFLKIYASGDTTSAAAISGYSAAGGCLISLLCDFRVMVNDSKAKIGFNDTMVGITPRPWVCGLMNKAMGQRQAELALTASTMYSAEEALKVNLIDKIANNKDDAIEKCKQFIKRYDNIPNEIKIKTRRNLRVNLAKLVDENREEDTNMFIESILDPSVQKQISIYKQQLKSIKKK